MISFSFNDLTVIKEGLQKYCDICLHGDTTYANAFLMLKDEQDEDGEKYFFHINGDPNKGYDRYAKEHEGVRDLYHAMIKVACSSHLEYFSVYFLDGEMSIAAEEEKEE